MRVAEAGGHWWSSIAPGSLNAAIGQGMGPGFTAADGYLSPERRWGLGRPGERDPDGRIRPDVFMSADAEVIDQVLMGAGIGGAASWYVNLCRQRMVLGYSPSFSFPGSLRGRHSGTRPWYEVLQAPDWS